MNYQDFMNKIKEQLSTIFDSTTQISITSIQKNNGIIQEGLIIRQAGLNISPTIYLKPYYLQYLDGISLEQIITDILFTYHQNVPRADFDITSFTDFSKMKHHIIFKLVNYERNLILLKEVPHIHYLDFAIVFQCLLRGPDENHATILIHNHHLQFWNATVDDLFLLASQNTPRLLPQVFENLEDILDFEETDFLVPELSMYVLTNCRKITGAATILYPGLLQHIAAKLGKNLILLPSSIHEFIIIPEDSPTRMTYYSNMVQEVNSMEVSDDEILSDHAYYYCQNTDKLIPL